MRDLRTMSRVFLALSLTNGFAIVGILWDAVSVGFSAMPDDELTVVGPCPDMFDMFSNGQRMCDRGMDGII